MANEEIMRLSDWEGTDEEILDQFDESAALMLEAIADEGFVFTHESSAKKLLLEVLSLSSIQEIIREKGIEIIRKEWSDDNDF